MRALVKIAAGVVVMTAWIWALAGAGAWGVFALLSAGPLAVLLFYLWIARALDGYGH